MGQTVLVGYAVAAVVEVGYEDGVQVGDVVVAVLQGVTLALQLTAIAIRAYTFPSMQKTAETSERQYSSPVQ
jgi:hypothetical protein